nr:transglutaminase domain-containing protein [Microbulbifer guangxiensis]
MSAVITFSSLSAGAADNLRDVQKLVDSGRYSDAREQIKQLLGNKALKSEHRQLRFEAERMRRIEMDFTLQRDDLLTSIQRYIPDATDADIEAWDNAGLLESKIIDGERRFFGKTAYNLVHISDAAAARTGEYRRFTDKAPLYQLHSHHREIIQAKEPVRKRIRVSYSLSVDPDAVPAGETVRAWLPFPKTIEGRQENVALLASSPSDHVLAPVTQPQRTIYFEKQAEPGKPVEFAVSYEFDSIARFTRINPERVKMVEPTEALTPFLGERAPHIQFSPSLRALSERIVGDETNPYRIAQKLFAYVDSIPWAGAREYSTIRNISQYAAEAGHADCGQQTMLLITLLRMNGIPARWESGWEFSPATFDTMHDWGQLYLAPYGWMPMDVTHGKLAGKNDSETWFYLGGIDAYRLIFNSDYGEPFLPAKQHFRSETVDSQRGEVEWRGGNLYFDQWDYSLEWEVVDQG